MIKRGIVTSLKGMKVSETLPNLLYTVLETMSDVRYYNRGVNRGQVKAKLIDSIYNGRMDGIYNDIDVDSAIATVTDIVNDMLISYGSVKLIDYNIVMGRRDRMSIITIFNIKEYG